MGEPGARGDRPCVPMASALLRLPGVKSLSPEQLASWDPKKNFRARGMTAEDLAAEHARAAFNKRLTRALHDAGACFSAPTRRIRTNR